MSFPHVAAVAALAALAAAGFLGPDRHDSGRTWRGLQFGTRRPPPPPPGRRVLPHSGPARWARARDVRGLTVADDLGCTGERGGSRGRLVIGRAGRRLLAAERGQSLIVFGPTQSLKTSGLAVPAILRWDGPVLATSVKTDLIEHTMGHRCARGTVAVYDPTAATGLGTASWSPLSASRTWPGARRAAAALTDVAKSSSGSMTDGDFWYATAARVLAPLLFAAAVGRCGMDDVLRWVATGEEGEVLELLDRGGIPEAVDVARSSFGKEDRTRSSIMTTIETMLEPFASLRYDGAAAPINPANLIGGSHTLYLCAPAHDQRRLTPLFASVVREVLEAVYDRVARSGKPLDPPLLVVLDEAANIAPLPDLDALASTAAGHGIQLVTVWHDLAQLTARYGQRATTVVNNHRAKLFLSGISDPSTLDYASHLIGEGEVAVGSTTTGGSGGPSTTRSISVRRLAPPDALRRIVPGEGVLVYRELPPARVRLRTYLDDPRLAERATAGCVTP
ncbi:MAG: type IV secretory system conjugative DNA transfer family protein [Acidimicrobiales bacterium]